MNNERQSDKLKLFYELYACNHVKLICLPKVVDFIKNESPDFITSDGAIGLEVVRSKIQKWKQLDSIVEKHFNKGLSANEIIDKVGKECKHGFEGSIIDLNGVAAYSPVKEGFFDTEILANRVIDVINDKTKLLESYLECKEYWLYVFTETSLIDAIEVDRINNVYQKLEYKKHYECVYILAPPNMFILKFGEIPCCIEFTDKISKNLLNIAKRESGLL